VNDTTPAHWSILPGEVAGEATSPTQRGMTYRGLRGGQFRAGAGRPVLPGTTAPAAPSIVHGNFAGGRPRTHTPGHLRLRLRRLSRGRSATPPSGGQHATHLGAGHGGSPINLGVPGLPRIRGGRLPSITDGRSTSTADDWNLRLTTPNRVSGTYSGSEAGVKRPFGHLWGLRQSLLPLQRGPGERDLGPYMVYQTVNWNGSCVLCHAPAADPGCEACHGFDTVAVNPTQLVTGEHARKGSVSHAKHVRAYGFMCHDCHSVTMLDRTANRRNLDPAATTHTNAQKDVNSAPGRRTRPGFLGGDHHTCTSTYCHSQGTSATAPFPAPTPRPTGRRGDHLCLLPQCNAAPPTRWAPMPTPRT